MKKICLITGHGKESKCTELKTELTGKNLNNAIKVGITTIAIIEICGANPIYAASGISDAVKPIVDILVDLAEPVSYGMMIKGMLSIATGKEMEGKKVIKNAGLGYLGVKFLPQIFEVIDQIKIS